MGCKINKIIVVLYLQRVYNMDIIYKFYKSETFSTTYQFNVNITLKK
ncbi:hypothetical protein KL86DYS2_10533 [uncultured Dysgonomonas sp.]|uniref:Uncharacterized protein n=1 Tax=uncultured Dysgonomonas sp. TaxID=206096 RepID=A0A212J224_9BACT|nr:hypothetical protein KL86DYS2_10533 [uncultured Dysgonomonas sp.]